jgi:myo-inositol 2-dehydrogenase / D-chiro-inositol 1-dehydrogenase
MRSSGSEPCENRRPLSRGSPGGYPGFARSKTLPGMRRDESSAMSPGSTLRVAVIGCGPIGSLHAAAVQASPLARLVSVCDIVHDRAVKLAQRLGTNVSPRARIEQILERDDVDVIVVATPDHLHVELVLAAIDRGCHVFCEKPIATMAAEARLLVEAAAARGVALGVNHNRRFGFGYRTARRLVDEGRLGPLHCIVIHVVDRTPRPEVARSPEVILTTLLTHHLDLARWFAGDVSRISARFGPPDPSAPRLRRSVILSLEFAGGALGSIIASYRDGQTRTFERAELVGSLGSVEVNDVTRTAVFRGADVDRLEVFKPSPFTDEAAFTTTIGDHVRTFLACVAAGEPPPVSGLDGLLGLELVEAALLSHRENRTVVLDKSPNPHVTSTP